MKKALSFELKMYLSLGLRHRRTKARLSPRSASASPRRRDRAGQSLPLLEMEDPLEVLAQLDAQLFIHRCTRRSTCETLENLSTLTAGWLLRKRRRRLPRRIMAPA